MQVSPWPESPNFWFPRPGLLWTEHRAGPRPVTSPPTADQAGAQPTVGKGRPIGLLFWGWGGGVGRGGQGAPASETPLFISHGIWFLGISFNKPVLTHEPGAGAGLGGAPPQGVRAWDLWACSRAISAPYLARRGTLKPAEASSLPLCRGLLSSSAPQVP